jgi:hypothetical protein
LLTVDLAPHGLCWRGGGSACLLPSSQVLLTAPPTPTSWPHGWASLCGGNVMV